MAETEVKSINGRTLCDNQARDDINKLENEVKGYAKQTDVDSLSGEIDDLKALLVDGNGVEY